MRNNQTGPVTIRGATYPNTVKAARALGVSPQTIGQARAAGTLDNVGLGLAGNLDGANNRRLTVIKGKVYESRAEAARALGISPSQLGTFLSVCDLLGIDATRP